MPHDEQVRAGLTPVRVAVNLEFKVKLEEVLTMVNELLDVTRRHLEMLSALAIESEIKAGTFVPVAAKPKEDEPCQTTP